MAGSDARAGSDNVVPMRRWEVREFFWGTAVRERRTGKWHCVFLKPDARQINVEDLDVAPHENGIEFLLPGSR